MILPDPINPGNTWDTTDIINYLFLSSCQTADVMWETQSAGWKIYLVWKGDSFIQTLIQSSFCKNSLEVGETAATIIRPWGPLTLTMSTTIDHRSDNLCPTWITATPVNHHFPFICRCTLQIHSGRNMEKRAHVERPMSKKDMTRCLQK